MWEINNKMLLKLGAFGFLTEIVNSPLKLYANILTMIFVIWQITEGILTQNELFELCPEIE